jgi:hypothetical protein
MMTYPEELPNEKTTCYEEYEGRPEQKFLMQFVFVDSDDGEEDREPRCPGRIWSMSVNFGHVLDSTMWRRRRKQ